MNPTETTAYEILKRARAHNEAADPAVESDLDARRAHRSLRDRLEAIAFEIIDNAVDDAGRRLIAEALGYNVSTYPRRSEDRAVAAMQARRNAYAEGDRDAYDRATAELEATGIPAIEVAQIERRRRRSA